MMRFINLKSALKSRQAIVVRLWRSTLRQQLLKLTLVKSLLAIASKPVIQMLKSGLSALVLAMFVDLADAPGELHDYWSGKCRSRSNQ